MKVLVIPVNAGGDLHPAVAVMLGMVERGHEVLAYAEHGAVHAMGPTGIDTVTSPRELDFSTQLLEDMKHAREHHDGSPADVLRATLRAYSQAQAGAAREQVFERFRPDVVVTSLVGAGIAEQLRVVGDVRSCVVNSDFYIGPDPPRPREQDFDERSLPEIDYLGDCMQRADLVLHAVDPEFDFGHDSLPEHNHYVGPLIWEKPLAVPKYLAEPGDPWALVAISTQKQDDTAIARLSMEALENQPVRILETIGGGHRAKELGHLPANAHVEHFAPHSAVLEQARVTVTHAGIGSVTKSLWYGVPLVLVPWGRDQPGVAARAQRLGAARIVDRSSLTRDAIDVALHEVLDDPSYAQAARSISERWQQLDPVAAACERLEKLALAR